MVTEKLLKGFGIIILNKRQLVYGLHPPIWQNTLLKFMKYIQVTLMEFSLRKQ